MGYDLHITRSADWFDHDGPQISVEEWRALVAADPELIPDPANNAPDFVRWHSPSVDAEAWLAWSEPGQIFTKYPDRPLVAKMLRLAKQLGARVQGDEGEFYTDPSQVPADLFSAKAARSKHSLPRTATSGWLPHVLRALLRR